MRAGVKEKISPKRKTRVITGVGNLGHNNLVQKYEKISPIEACTSVTMEI